MRTIFLLVLWLAASPRGNAQEPATSVPSISDKRHALEQVSRLPTDQRIAAIEKSLRAEPHDPQLQLALGSAFLQKMRETTDFQYLRRAAALDEAVLRVDPESYDAQRLSVEIDMHKHEFRNAAEAARRLLETNAADTGMLGLLGDALMEMNQCEDAGQIYKRMASLGGNLFSYNRLAFHAFITGDMTAALSWMAEAVAAGSPANENLAWVNCEMADLLFKAGRITDAVRAYDSAIQAFPGYHRAHAGLGAIQAARGQWNSASQSFKQAQAAVPFPQYAAALEQLYQKIGDSAASARERALVDAVDKLMAANGETTNRALVLIYADAGRNLPRALQLAQAEFELRSDVYSWDALSWALLKNNRVKEASEASSKALARHTPDPMLYFHAGMIASAAGDREQARALLQKALGANPTFDFRNAPIAQAELQRLTEMASGAK